MQSVRSIRNVARTNAAPHPAPIPAPSIPAAMADTRARAVRIARHPVSNPSRRINPLRRRAGHSLAYRDYDRRKLHF